MTGTALPFGRFGEITPATIQAAALTGAERDRAHEILEVQAAYLALLDHLRYPVAPDGTIHDLSAIEPTRLAVAYTLALCGFRQTGKTYITKVPLPGGGHTWADSRTPATRVPPAQPFEGWHTEPTVTVEHIAREDT